MDERQMTLLLHRAIGNLKKSQQQLLRRGDIEKCDMSREVRELVVVTKDLERILREL
jgi:hypothetical protein